LVVLWETLWNQSEALNRVLDASEDMSERPETPTKQFRRRKSLSFEDEAAIVARYQRGETTRQIAARHGIGHGRVGLVLRRAGVRLRLDGLTSAEIDLAAETYAGGASLANVANLLNSTANTVRTRLIERGIVMRDLHGNPRPQGSALD
jgi:DNA-binding CsgD family transcriptional regulator